MFPVLQPGVVDPGPARRPDPGVLTPVVGVTPVALDPHAPRAAAPQVDASRAQSTSVRPEPPLQPGAAAQRPPAGLAVALPSAGPGTQAALVAPQLQWLLQCLQQLGPLAAGEAGEATATLVRWPTPGQPVAATPAEALDRLRDSLGRSALFAANPRTPAALVLATARAALAVGSAGLVVSGDLPVAPGQAGSVDAAASPWPQAAPADFSASRTLAGEIDTTRQALQLLLHGRLQWSGELTPGVPARLLREDAWEEDPRQPGKLLAGSALRIEIDLPASGPLVVLARQVGEHLDLRLLPDSRHAPRFEAALADLRTALALLTERPIDLQMQMQAPTT
jgi:hypothetical protein